MYKRCPYPDFMFIQQKCPSRETNPLRKLMKGTVISGQFLAYYSSVLGVTRFSFYLLQTSPRHLTHHITHPHSKLALIYTVCSKHYLAKPQSQISTIYLQT
jgi:hypothetical protein